MINLRQPFLIITFLVFSLAFSSVALAAEKCPDVPSVSWWGDTSPAGLAAYVNRKHDGDWTSYVKKWQAYEDRMREILNKGKSAIIKSQALTLQGKDLENHIELIAKRVKATRCLASQVMQTRLNEDLNNMNTSSGGNVEADLSVQTNAVCAKFAKVAWWKISHAKVASYVAKKHGGDWKPYVNKWGKQLEKMQAISKRGGAAVFKSRNLKLEGDVLLQYIDAIKDRLAVTKCLAHRELVNSADKKNAAANDG